MLLEYWHTTYLEEGVGEGGGGQPGSDCAVMLGFGEITYNKPGGLKVHKHEKFFVSDFEFFTIL
jgi:hypothetical protein